MIKPIELITHPPFNPIHDQLYNPFELLEHFNPENALSLPATPDFQCFLYFHQQGGTTISDPYAAMMEALHDTSVVREMNAFLTAEMQAGRRPVAIMGGHREPRGSKAYRDVARIAQKLSESGFIVVSGGGPGCMEATHLGALFAGRSADSLTSAINRLAEKPFDEFPKNMHHLIGKDGRTINEELLSDLHAWMLPAWEIANDLKDQLTPLNRSLALPTWYYGHEPFTPFATHVAKYFLNSIREDVLLTLASCGIVFSEGRGGTIQEVFQDAGQVYYRDTDNKAPITSMLFLDSKFWTLPEVPDGKLHMPVLNLLHQLFVVTGNMTEEEFKRYIRLVDDVEEVVNIIIENAPSASEVVHKLTRFGISKINSELMAERAETLVSQRRK
jgi:predicted Rossmann-fold nucleotide-binding protein